MKLFKKIPESALTILEKIESREVTLLGWLASFAAILFVRFFLESLSSPTPSGIIPSDALTLVHYTLGYAGVLLGLICIVGSASKNYAAAAKLGLFALPFMWIPPLLDIILSRGEGRMMGYLFEGGKFLVYNFFTFFGPSFQSGVTTGIRIELALVLLGIGFYIYLKTRRPVRAVITAVAAYTFLFIMASIPGILCTALSPGWVGLGRAECTAVVAKALVDSNLTHNTLRESALFLPTSRFLELAFNKLMSQLFLLVSMIAGAWFLCKLQRQKFASVIKNSRPERIAFYLMLLMWGGGFAYVKGFAGPFSTLDVFGYISLVVSWIGLWMYVVHINDIADIAIDRISNKNRPLVAETLSVDDMRQTAYLWLGLSCAGAWAAGFYPFFMNLTCIAISYIYSMPPFRLRRFPILSSFLIGVACLATILAAFFFVSIDKRVELFPIFLASGIVLILTLAENARDVKDAEGDRINGVYTLPGLWGEKGIRVTGLLLASGFLLIPYFLGMRILYALAVPAAVLAYLFVVRKPFREKNIFILYFLFSFGTLIFMYLFL